MFAQSQTVRPARQTPAKPRCSFCGKGEEQVEHLIASKDNVHICADCVALCAEIIAEHRATGTTT